MKIKDVNEEIKDLNGEPIGKITIDIDAVIKQIKLNGTVDGLLKNLEDIKSSAQTDVTYLKVLESACWVDADKEKENPGVFLDTLMLAQKLRKEESLTEAEIDKLKKGVCKVGYSAIAKAMTIKKLSGNSEEGK